MCFWILVYYSFCCLFEMGDVFGVFWLLLFVVVCFFVLGDVFVLYLIFGLFCLGVVGFILLSSVAFCGGGGGVKKIYSLLLSVW